MAKFVFNLEALLRQREHAEQQCQRVLATRQRALAECDGELARLNETVQKTNDDVRQHHLTGVLDMSFLAAHRRFMFAMQRQALSIAQRIAAAQKAVDEARVALGEAAKQRKIMEKLREKQLERWRAEQARKDAAEQDEVGMQLSYDNLHEAAAAANDGTNESEPSP
jgi:flagellar FliJ protein